MGEVNRLKLEREVILTSIYCDILKKLVANYSGTSIAKLLVFSYIVKKKLTLKFEIYSGKNDKELVLKCLSQLAGLYDDFLKNIQFIINAMHILIQNERIECYRGDLLSGPALKASNRPPFGKFMDKVIIESINYSDRQFLREVISGV